MNELDILRCMYEEHTTMGRHHEEQREKVTQLVVLMGGGLLGWISHEHFCYHTIPVAGFLIVLGFFGWLITQKHYERNRMHTTIAGAFRDEIGKRVDLALGKIRDDAKEVHEAKFPFLHNRRLHTMWGIFSLLISAAGIACIVFTFVKSS